MNFDSSVSVEFGGTSTVGTLTQNHGTLTVSGDLTTNAYTGVNLPGGDNSTVSVSSGASWTNTGDFYLRHTGNGTTTFTVDGNVNVGGKLYISRDGNGTIEINDGGVLAVSTLEFGQYWDGVASKGSWVNVNAGGTLVLDTISIGNNLNTSELKLNGGTFGTSSAALTIDASTTSGAGAGALPLTLGTGTTSTIRTSVYENNAFGATAATISIVNAISGDGALNVDGTGTLTLSGANSYTGGTTISGGKLIATNASALGTNTVTANANGTLELAFADETFANALAGDGAVSVNSTGTLTLSGDNCNFEGVLSVAAGTLNASGTALGAGMVSVASGATLALSGNLTLFSTIENAGTTNIANGTTFVLDNLTATNNVYTLISGEGTVSGWDALTNASFTQSGTTVSSLRKSASGYTVLAGNGELTWTGASSSVWDTDTTANWTFDGGVSSVNFFDGDSVIFATENAQVSFAENASVAPANMSVNKNVTFSGTNATINVLAGALTIADSQTLTINDGVTLDLGATDTNVSLNIAGSGKIKRTNSGGHGVRTAITGDFSGTLDYSGQLGLANYALNENAMLRISELTSGNEMWSKSGIAKVLNNDIVFATNYTINIGGDDITLGGNVSFENSDNTLTVKNGWPHQGGTLTISGTATIGTMAISDGSV
ncbi:MAG: autotransporter-associated beta strand repeat-containing protein, partial [Opitutales bacterium]|nr:autotransporter-associated beta strand repeat-containing protein [Opitutales bacterium]